MKKKYPIILAVLTFVPSMFSMDWSKSSPRTQQVSQLLVCLEKNNVISSDVFDQLYSTKKNALDKEIDTKTLETFYTLELEQRKGKQLNEKEREDFIKAIERLVSTPSLKNKISNSNLASFLALKKPQEKVSIPFLIKELQDLRNFSIDEPITTQTTHVYHSTLQQLSEWSSIAKLVYEASLQDYYFDILNRYTENNEAYKKAFGTVDSLHDKKRSPQQTKTFNEAIETVKSIPLLRVLNKLGKSKTRNFEPVVEKMPLIIATLKKENLLTSTTLNALEDQNSIEPILLFCYKQLTSDSVEAFKKFPANKKQDKTMEKMASLINRTFFKRKPSNDSGVMRMPIQKNQKVSSRKESVPPIVMTQFTWDYDESSPREQFSCRSTSSESLKSGSDDSDFDTNSISSDRKSSIESLSDPEISPKKSSLNNISDTLEVAVENEFEKGSSSAKSNPILIKKDSPSKQLEKK